MEIERFNMGRVAAEADVCNTYFDVDQAIASFESSPADSAYQRGYLRGLLKSGYASAPYLSSI